MDRHRHIRLRHPYTHASVCRALARLAAIPTRPNSSSILSPSPSPNLRPDYQYKYVWETLYHLACRSEPPLGDLDADMLEWRALYPQPHLAAFWDWTPVQIRTKFELVTSGRSHIWAADHLPSHEAFLRNLD